VLHIEFYPVKTVLSTAALAVLYREAYVRYLGTGIAVPVPVRLYS
jgi:hypothetical protein